MAGLLATNKNCLITSYLITLQTVTALSHHLPPHLSPGTSPSHAALSLLPAYCACILLRGGGGGGGGGLRGGGGGGAVFRAQAEAVHILQTCWSALLISDKQQQTPGHSLKGTRRWASLVPRLLFLFLPELQFCPGHQGQG